MRHISIIGCDGAGKSTIARLLRRRLEGEGLRVEVVWSRFNSLISKPLLALARVSGHSYYEAHEGVRFGYHDFQRAWVYRWPFVLAQGIDARIGAFRRNLAVAPAADVVLWERSAWDSLVDVRLDTGLERVFAPSLRWLFVPAFLRRGCAVALSRQLSGILESRPELRFDRRLKEKLKLYADLAALAGLPVISNDGSLASAVEDVGEACGLP